MTRTLRLLRAVGVAALVCAAFYLIGMNVFLSTPLFERAIDATPDVVDIHYTRGWSFFPTRIHAQGLSIRGTDSHVEWILRFDEVEFDCSLVALAKKQFHVTRARGSGITFRVRMKVASPAATREYLDPLPPIDSLGPVAFIPSDPPYAGEWSDADWHLWTVRIDDAVAEHVREVWIQGVRFQGDARITGGFYLKPIRAAEVGPAHVDVRAGSVTVDARTVAEPVVGNLDLHLERFDPRTVKGADLVHHISLSVDASATIPDLDHLSLSLPSSGQLWGEVDVGRLALRMTKGVLRDGTHVEARATNVRATTAAHVVSGGFDLTADVAHDALVVQAALAHVDADFALEAPRVALLADSAALDLAEPFGDLHATIDVTGAALPRAERLMDYLPKGGRLRIVRGALLGSLHAEGWRATKLVRGKADVRVKDAEVLAGKLRARGSGEVTASVGSLRFDPRRATGVQVGVTVAEGRVSSSDSEGPVTQVAALRARAEGDVTAHVARGTASLDAHTVDVVSGKLRVAAGLRGAARAHWDFGGETLGGDLHLTVEHLAGGFDARASAPDFVADRIDVSAAAPSVDLAHPSMRGVDYALHVGRAELFDARTLNGFLPDQDAVAVESGRVLASADLGTSGPSRAANGRLQLFLTHGGLRLHQTRLAGDVSVDVKAHDLDVRRAVVDLEGSRIAMRDVRVTGASTNSTAWGGDLVLEAGTLALAPPRLDGDLTLRALDANPVLALLFRDTLPDYLAALTPMTSFTAVAHLDAQPDALAVSDLFASGGGLGVRGTYVLRKGETAGAFVVQKGPWSVGIGLDDAGSHVRLFGLDRWYGEHARQALAPR